MYLLCKTCDLEIGVVGPDEEAEELLGAASPHHDARCPSCGNELKRLHGKYCNHTAGSNVRNLTPLETHLYLEGMGFPSERLCTKEVVESVLVGNRVSSVSSSTVSGTTRTVVERITMEDGTTLFLSGASWGAVVYRVRPPNPYVNRKS